MTPQEMELKIKELERKIQELEQYVEMKKIQQISFPVDPASATIIKSL